MSHSGCGTIAEELVCHEHLPAMDVVECVEDVICVLPELMDES